MLLFTTIGRRSGKPRTVPLGYFHHGDAFVVTASNAGFDNDPAWYLNLRRNPNVTREFPDRVTAAVVQPAEVDLRQNLWEDLLERVPGYGAYQKRTSRLIPVVLLRPVPVA